MKKPKKIIYMNQDEVHGKIVSYLKSQLPKTVFEAYLWGSAAERKFGKYTEKYGEHEGSDIDVIVMIAHSKIPKSWKDLKTSRGWWNLYRGGQIDINDTAHKVDLLVVKEGLEDFVRERIIEKGWKVERLK